MMINPKYPKPLYVQLKQELERAIKQGIYKADDLLPSERELCKKYNVSRITVRQAIAEAEKEGLLYKIQGKGTYVSKPKIEQGLVKITSFSKTLLNKGLKGETRIVIKDIIPVDFEVANILNLDLSEQVVNLALIGLANKEPLVYYNSYFLFQIGMQMIKAAEKNIKDKKAFSTFDLYKQINLPLESVDQTFEAVNCNKELAKLLKVEEGQALFMVTSIIYTTGKKPVEFKKAMYKGDKYRFHITRHL